MLMMLPFEAPTIFEGIHKSYFRMPRVVKDQRSKFENDDLFRQLSHESTVKYTGFRDRPLEERQMKFIANCQEGHTEISVVQSGNQFTLMFNEGCDFDKELGKVHIKSSFILNGVCVLWRGWIDLQRLEGFGCLEFDEYRAYLEDAMLRQQIDKQQSCNTSQQQQQTIQQSSLSRFSQQPTLAMAQLASQLAPPPNMAMNPNCLGAGSGTHPALAPAISSASSAAANHYGNAAIAAANVFHQALRRGAGQTKGAQMHNITCSPSSLTCLPGRAPTSHPSPLLASNPHLSYADGASLAESQQNQLPIGSMPGI